jgi:D-aspartate ligase
MKTAIVLASHTMGLGVIRSLGTMGVPVAVVYYDDRDMGFVSKYVTEAIKAPHPEQSEADFVGLLMAQAPRLSGGMLIPTSDATVSTVSRHRSLLAQHYLVACTDWEITQRFMDKKETYAIAQEAGVPAPKTIVPRSEGDVEEYAGSVEYPCLVKPTYSHRYYAAFKEKMVRVSSFDQMISAYRQAAEAGFEVMLQELIPGDDTNGANYNSYFWGGEALVEFTAQKLRSAPPELGSPRVAVSKVIPEVMELGRKILKALGFYGYSCTEFKKDPRDGVYKLMEVNGRHNLSTLLAVRCGINFPWIHYQHLMLGQRPAPRPFEEGIYWIDLLRDLGYSAKAFRKEPFSAVDYVRPYVKPHVFAILDLKDPKPFIKRCGDLAKGVLPSSKNGRRKKLDPQVAK